MRSILLFFLIMIGVSFSGSAAKAQELDQLHEKIKQNWAFPDCGTPSENALFTRFFFLKSAQDSLTLTNYSLKPGGKDYLTLARGVASSPVRLENDGILKIGVPAAGNGRPAAWENFNFDHIEEYAACAKPAAFPKAITRLLRYLDRIEEQCTVSVTNDCARVLFKLADENNDKSISDAEIRKAVLSALLFAELADKGTLSDADIKSVATRTKQESPAIAADLLSRFDRDGSKGVDYNELMTGFSPPRLPVIKEMLEKSGKLIPVFALVAKTL